MTIILFEGVNPPLDGKIINRPRPISMISLQASKSHSSQKPKNEHMSPATTSAHWLDTPVHTATISPVSPELQLSSN